RAPCRRYNVSNAATSLCRHAVTRSRSDSLSKLTVGSIRVTSIAVWTWTRSIALEIFVIHALRMNAKGLRPTGTSLLLLMVISEKRLLGLINRFLNASRLSGSYLLSRQTRGDQSLQYMTRVSTYPRRGAKKLPGSGQQSQNRGLATNAQLFRL